MGSLAVGYMVGSFLQFDDLLVDENAPIMDDLHRVFGLAVISEASCWLGNPTAIDIDQNGVAAFLAAEEGFLHVGDDRSCSDNKTFDANQCVHVCLVSIALCVQDNTRTSRVKISHVHTRIKSKWKDLEWRAFGFSDQIRNFSLRNTTRFVHGV